MELQGAQAKSSAKPRIMQDVHFVTSTSPNVCVIQQAEFPAPPESNPLVAMSEQRISRIQAALDALQEEPPPVRPGAASRRSASVPQGAGYVTEMRGRYLPWHSGAV